MPAFTSAQTPILDQNAPAPAKVPQKAAMQTKQAKSKAEVADSSEEDEPLTNKNRKPKSAPKKTKRPVSVQEVSEKESEEEQEEEVEEEDSDEPSESPSEDDLDSGSDFEEPSPKAKKTKTATPRKPRVPKEDRIPVIRRKAGTTKTPRAPKASKPAKASKSSGASMKKPVVRAPLTDAEGENEEEEQSELYSEHLVSLSTFAFLRPKLHN
jgi:putative endonuclease